MDGVLRCWRSSPARSRSSVASVEATIERVRHVLHRVGAAVRARAGDRRRGGRQLRDVVAPQDTAWTRIAFNAAAPAVSMWAGAQVFFLIARRRRRSSQSDVRGRPRSSFRCSALTVIYFALEFGADRDGDRARVAPVAGRASGGATFQWLSHRLSGGGFAGVLPDSADSAGAASWRRGVILPLLTVFHLTLRASFGRVEDARRHLGAGRSPLPVHGRDAGHGDRRQRRCDAQPRGAGAGVRDRPGAGARHHRRARVEGDRSGRAPARHREAGGARTHPQQARQADGRRSSRR